MQFKKFKTPITCGHSFLYCCVVSIGVAILSKILSRSSVSFIKNGGIKPAGTGVGV